MKLGVREICDVVLKAKGTMKLGNDTFYKDEPVLHFDTLKTSTLEGESTTVYAQGGKGNANLIAWDGEKNITFSMEDALISPKSLSVLAGAKLLGATKEKPVYVHTTQRVTLAKENEIVVDALIAEDEKIYKIFILTLDAAGEIVGEPCIPNKTERDTAKGVTTITCYGHDGEIPAGATVMVDFYVAKESGVQVIDIAAESFGGNFYLEASTLFREQSTGTDLPAMFIIPNCKVQSNFTFEMASSGDPSTFNFVLDAFPDYIKGRMDEDKMFASIQLIDELADAEAETERAKCEAKPSGAPVKPADEGK